MIVISDASVLINLAIIGHLDLLQKLFQEIIIPEAVFHEVTVKGAGKPGDQEVRSSDWIQVVTIQNAELVKTLLEEIDPGEAEGITLAVEMDAELLLIDEKLGREKAKAFGIKTVGLLGLLLEAKRLELIENITDLMDELRARANFKIGKSLYQKVKELAGE